METTSPRDQALLRELTMLKRLNSTIANITQTIEKTGQHIETCKISSDKSLKLIAKYNEILDTARIDQKLSDEMDEFKRYDEKYYENEDELEHQVLQLERENDQLSQELENLKRKQPNERDYKEMADKRRKELGLDFRRR